MIGTSNIWISQKSKSSSMAHPKLSPNHGYTRLHARITEEEGAFTVSVRMHNHLKRAEGAWGEEIAPSIDMATVMIDVIAEEFGIEKNCISISIVMANFKDGTFH